MSKAKNLLVGFLLATGTSMLSACTEEEKKITPPVVPPKDLVETTSRVDTAKLVVTGFSDIEERFAKDGSMPWMINEITTTGDSYLGGNVFAKTNQEFTLVPIADPKTNLVPEVKFNPVGTPAVTNGFYSGEFLSDKNIAFMVEDANNRKGKFIKIETSSFVKENKQKVIKNDSVFQKVSVEILKNMALRISGSNTLNPAGINQAVDFFSTGKTITTRSGATIRPNTFSIRKN